MWNLWIGSWLFTISLAPGLNSDTVIPPPWRPHPNWWRSWFQDLTQGKKIPCPALYLSYGSSNGPLATAITKKEARIWIQLIYWIFFVGICLLSWCEKKVDRNVIQTFVHYAPMLTPTGALSVRKNPNFFTQPTTVPQATPTITKSSSHNSHK